MYTYLAEAFVQICHDSEFAALSRYSHRFQCIGDSKLRFTSIVLYWTLNTFLIQIFSFHQLLSEIFCSLALNLPLCSKLRAEHVVLILLLQRSPAVSGDYTMGAVRVNRNSDLTKTMHWRCWKLHRAVETLTISVIIVEVGWGDLIQCYLKTDNNSDRNQHFDMLP